MPPHFGDVSVDETIICGEIGGVVVRLQRSCCWSRS